MNQTKQFGAITSSIDPTQVSNTVKGLVVAFSGVIILVAQQFFHITLSANDIISLATELSVGAGAVWTIYGLIMKVLAYFFKTPVVVTPQA